MTTQTYTMNYNKNRSMKLVQRFLQQQTFKEHYMYKLLFKPVLEKPIKYWAYEVTWLRFAELFYHIFIYYNNSLLEKYQYRTTLNFGEYRPCFRSNMSSCQLNRFSNASNMHACNDKSRQSEFEVCNMRAEGIQLLIHHFNNMDKKTQQNRMYKTKIFTIFL